MGKAGHRSRRGVGELYDEPKDKQVIVLMTATGRDGLDAIACDFNLSRSELMERIGRGMLKVVYTAAKGKSPKKHTQS